MIFFSNYVHSNTCWCLWSKTIYLFIYFLVYQVFYRPLVLVDLPQSLIISLHFVDILCKVLDNTQTYILLDYFHMITVKRVKSVYFVWLMLTVQNPWRKRQYSYFTINFLDPVLDEYIQFMYYEDAAHRQVGELHKSQIMIWNKEWNILFYKW